MIKFGLSLEFDSVTVVAFAIEGGVCEPADLASINPPDVDGTKGVVISGRGPVWLYAALAHHYHVCAWVGTFDPRLGGAVVTSRHSPTAPAVGTVVTLPKAEAAYQAAITAGEDGEFLPIPPATGAT